MGTASLSWFFLDRNRLENTQEYLASCEKEGVLDPLGLGILRNSYADDLFPGVTVQHTKIKYIFFILNKLHEYYVGGGKSRKKITYANRDEMEKDLRKILIKSIGKNDLSGIIGHTISNGLPIIRPSAIYWPCIKTLGLLSGVGAMKDISLANLDSLREQLNELAGYSIKNTEKDGTGGEDEQLVQLQNDLNSIFKSVIDVINDNEDKSFWKTWDLNSKQAEFLRKHYKTKDDTLGSTLMYPLIVNRQDYSDVDQISLLLPHFTENKKLKAANDFSFISGGMYKFFSYFLLEECRQKGIFKNEIKELDDKDALVTDKKIDMWMRKLDARMMPYDLDVRCQAYTFKNPFEFINTFFKLSLSSKGSWAAHKEEFKKIVFTREVDYKFKCRAKSENLIDLINPATDLMDHGDHYYDYRWQTAREHVYFIRKGLGERVAGNAFNT